MFTAVYMLWFNFIFGINFIFHCFKVIIIHYHTPKQRIRLNYNIYNIFVFPVQFFNHRSSLLVNVLLLTDVLKMFKNLFNFMPLSVAFYFPVTHNEFGSLLYLWTLALLVYCSVCLCCTFILQCVHCSLSIGLLFCCDNKEKYFLVYRFLTAGKCHWKPLNGQLPSR